MNEKHEKEQDEADKQDDYEVMGDNPESNRIEEDNKKE